MWKIRKFRSEKISDFHRFRNRTFCVIQRTTDYSQESIIRKIQIYIYCFCKLLFRLENFERPFKVVLKLREWSLTRALAV